MAGTAAPHFISFDGLIDILRRQVDALVSLRAQLKDQQEHLVRFRVDDLERSTAEIADSTARLAGIEKRRYEWISENLGNPDITLTKLVQAAPETLRPVLRALHKDLRAATRALLRLSVDNSDLMRNGVGIVEGMLNLYKHSMNVRPLYGRETVQTTVGIEGVRVNATL